MYPILFFSSSNSHTQSESMLNYNFNRKNSKQYLHYTNIICIYIMVKAGPLLSARCVYLCATFCVFQPKVLEEITTHIHTKMMVDPVIFVDRILEKQNIQRGLPFSNNTLLFPIYIYYVLVKLENELRKKKRNILIIILLHETNNAINEIVQSNGNISFIFWKQHLVVVEFLNCVFRNSI